MTKEVGLDANPKGAEEDFSLKEGWGLVSL